MAATNPSHPPAELRIGTLKAALWANDVNGRTRYNVTFNRLYRTDQGEWRTSRSFRRDDLLVLAKLANRAHSRVFELEAAATPSSRPAVSTAAPSEGVPGIVGGTPEGEENRGGSQGT